MERTNELIFKADLLREEIRKAKLSQNKVAKAMRMSTKTFSQKMNGKYDWTLKEIQGLQNILTNVDVCLIFNLKGGKSNGESKKILNSTACGRA